LVRRTSLLSGVGVMTTPTDSAVVFANKTQDIVTSAKSTYGIADIFYGDQIQIGRTPTVCIWASSKRREIAGAPRRSHNTLEAYLMVYISKVQDVQLNSLEADTLAEGLETELHKDPTLGGLVFHSLVTSIEFGYQTRSNTQFRTARITFQGESKTLLPMSPGYNQ
jgi:hypothetical protein